MHNDIEIEKLLIEELRSEFNHISASISGLHGERRWLDNNIRLNELVMSDDPRGFLQWDVIKRTMEVGNAEFIEEELDFLRNSGNWSRWEKAIVEVSVGSPTMSDIYPASSGNLIHHAYHVARFEAATSRKVEDMECIFEFGGGYGGMCRLIHNLGFAGKYILFDFPAFSALQKYFIKSLGLEISDTESFKDARSGVLCLSDFGKLQESLSQQLSPQKSMLLATWSLSECPLDLRSQILLLVSDFKNFLLAYQGQFEGLDNIGFFNELKESRPDIDWHDLKIEHIPNEFYRDNFYLMGS